MRVEYSQPLAAWIFPRQGTHGSYAVDGWMCSCAFCLFLENKSWPLEKAKSRQRKRQRTQAACTTTSTKRRVHCTVHFTAARKPTACICFSAFRRMRLTHSAVVSKAYVEKCREAKRSSNACSVKKIQKRANCKKTIPVGPNK